jgi:hypothetical protein
MASPVSDLPEAKRQKLVADVRAIAVIHSFLSLHLPSGQSTATASSHEGQIIIKSLEELQTFRDPTNVVRISAFPEFG